MVLNQTFELSMVLDTDHFQRIFDRVYGKSGYLKALDDEHLDTSLVEKGITVIYRNSRYKKKIRLLINTSLVVDNPSNVEKLLHKLDKHISEYFDHRYVLGDFTLSGVTLTVDIKVGSRTDVSNYLIVMQRIGKVKGFSPVCFDYFNDKASLCLSGNSNDIDFLLYDLEDAVMGQLQGGKKIKLASMQNKGILRAEVRLNKPKVIRSYTDAAGVYSQITELTKNSSNAFMETFTQIIPFGDFYKKDRATEIIQQSVKDHIMKRKMLRLLALIPEKKSLYLAQKAMNCRNVEKVMKAFAEINLSPVTISKRHEVKHLDNFYSYFLK